MVVRANGGHGDLVGGRGRGQDVVGRVGRGRGRGIREGVVGGDLARVDAVWCDGSLRCEWRQYL